MCCGIHLHTGTRSLHDQPDNDDEEHEQESLHTTPNIDNLGQGELGGTAQNGRNNADNWKETMTLE
jgi:hypothetical protein